MDSSPPSSSALWYDHGVTYAPFPRLRQNDKVAVIAPSGPFDKPSFEKGLAILSSRYAPVFSESMFTSHRYLAGVDDRRYAELVAAVNDPDIKAIFTARGGYGATRLLLRSLPVVRKPLVGFSDITALHAWAQGHGVRSLHAPVLTQLGKQPQQVVDRMFSWLENPRPPPSLQGDTAYVKGAAEGPLLGGNLAVLSRLIGTPWMPKLKGAILLLEDVGERPYQLDRIWTHLRLSGAFDGVAGIALGEFTGCEERDDVGYSSVDVISELADDLAIPCAAGFGIGHGDINWPVALGARVRLDATGHRLEFLEGLVT